MEKENDFLKQLKFKPDAKFEQRLGLKLMDLYEKKPKNSFDIKNIFNFMFMSKYKIFAFSFVAVVGVIGTLSFANPALAKSVYEKIGKCNVDIKCYTQDTSKWSRKTHIEKNKYGWEVEFIDEFDENGKSIGGGYSIDPSQVDYNLIMTKIGAKIESETNTKVVYVFPNGTKATLYRNVPEYPKPYLDFMQLNNSDYEKIMNEYFEGTSVKRDVCSIEPDSAETGIDAQNLVLNIFGTKIVESKSNGETIYIGDDCSGGKSSKIKTIDMGAYLDVFQYSPVVGTGNDYIVKNQNGEMIGSGIENQKFEYIKRLRLYKIDGKFKIVPENQKILSELKEVYEKSNGSTIKYKGSLYTITKEDTVRINVEDKYNKYIYEVDSSFTKFLR